MWFKHSRFFLLTMQILSNKNEHENCVFDIKSSLTLGFDEGELEAEDGSLWGGSDDELDRESDLDREWQRRHDQFHTVILWSLLWILFYIWENDGC